MIIIAALVFVTIIFSGCSLNTAILIPTDFQKEIYNQNNKIISEDNYTFLKRVKYDKEDYKAIEFEGFYGSNTLELMELEESAIVNIDFESEIVEGKFKIVLITPKKEVMNISENTEKGRFKFIAPEGSYAIKIVGNSASGKVIIKTSKDDVLSG